MVSTNPARESLMVQWVSTYRGAVSIALTDVNGKTVSDWESTKSNAHFEHRIAVPSLPEGMYFVRIREAKKMMVRKWMKVF